MDVNHGGLHIPVTEKLLDNPDVVAALQETIWRMHADSMRHLSGFDAGPDPATDPGPRPDAVLTPLKTE